ncbi:CaiB/BaiF CoA transferase family protein [Mycobacterium branderi]|uniref:Carnitine dehydratase n=1 Tax=Mycobacterium branderi TaxID=43348 RepID=A0A7I7WEF5_9MYCO|nr:CoA transferase [Mycobacterium branderi]MCV7231883.1 CoA transferase [Mycobacterium branderi]ORA40177.1 carnitine dehydratase [Mycobacterium branderi]BBZ15460.1 CoA transferase [Mycobacterium branderi]
MTATQNGNAGPLRGLRVLDFSTFLAGPFCTQVLGDLGAEIIKVESPHGDSSRSIPPHFIDGESVYYLSVNRNKKSVVIDLKTSAGRELALSLAGKVDVVVENFGPGARHRLGFDAEAICAAHPRLIWSSITGFGRDGKRAKLPAYDLIVQALSGVMMTTGEPGGPPVRLGIPAGDLVAGLYSCIGILAELADRDRSNGAHIVDVSMFDGLLSMLSYLGAYTLFTGAAPGPQGSAHASIPTYRSFVAGDGQRLVITANTERMWRELCKVLDCADLIEDPRYRSGPDRLTNSATLWPILEEAFRRRPATQWVELCNERDVPAAVVTDVPEALEDARSDSRSMIMRLQCPSGARAEVLGNPVKLAGQFHENSTYPPRLGEHTRQVLHDTLGLTDQELDQLLTEGAIK